MDNEEKLVMEKLWIENAALYLYIAKLKEQHEEVLRKIDVRINSDNRTIKEQHKQIAELKRDAAVWYEKEKKLYEKYIEETTIPVIREENSGVGGAYKYGLLAIRGILKDRLPDIDGDLARLYQIILKNVPDIEFTRFFVDNPNMMYVVTTSEDK